MGKKSTGVLTEGIGAFPTMRLLPRYTRANRPSAVPLADSNSFHPAPAHNL